MLKDPQTIAEATGCKTEAVAKALPCIVDALREQDMLTERILIGVLATVAVECEFLPVEEAYWLSPAERDARFDKSKYGRVDDETGKRYYGRGFIQLTWKSNYEKYGKMLGIELVHRPELALEPATAAKVLAAFFITNGVHTACEERNWELVRRKVNGGLNGWTKFAACVEKLEKLC